MTSVGLKAGDHMTISPIGPLASGWGNVSVTVYCSVDSTYHMLINNRGGGALSLPSQNFAVRFYH